MKNILLLAVVATTLFACTKSSVAPLDQQKGRKDKTTALTLTQTSTATLSDFGTASFTSVEKTPEGNKISIHIETDSVIYQVAIQVMSDSTLGSWSGLGGFGFPYNFSPVQQNPYDNYVMDYYVGNNPQPRTYKGFVVVNGGSIDLGTITAQ